MFATQSARYRYPNPLRVSVALATEHLQCHVYHTICAVSVQDRLCGKHGVIPVC
jgi:hypothetical protein